MTFQAEKKFINIYGLSVCFLRSVRDLKKLLLFPFNFISNVPFGICIQGHRTYKTPPKYILVPSCAPCPFVLCRLAVRQHAGTATPFITHSTHRTCGSVLDNTRTHTRQAFLCHRGTGSCSGRPGGVGSGGTIHSGFATEAARDTRAAMQTDTHTHLQLDGCGDSMRCCADKDPMRPSAPSPPPPLRRRSIERREYGRLLFIISGRVIKREAEYESQDLTRDAERRS